MQKTLLSWGLSASIDLHGCNPEFIRSPEKIQEFVIKLCDHIKMMRFGDTIIQRLGKAHLGGYSMFQFIETSSITAHFEEIENRAFIDIFSCRRFDADKAAQFCKDFFEAKDCGVKTFNRA